MPFYGCNSLKIVNYDGYKPQWKKIIISDYNEPLLQAQITFKEPENGYGGSCNENLNWSFDTETKTLTFSGTGELYFDKAGDYCGKPLPWQNIIEDSDVEKINVSDGITYVYLPDFSECNNLKELNLGKDVKSIKSFSTYDLVSINVASDNLYMTSVDGILFNKNENSLIIYPMGKEESSYTIPNNVKIIEQDAFYGCENLKNIIIPDSVRTIGNGAFYGSGIVDLVIPDTVNLIESGAFAGCENLKSVKIGAGITELNNVFYGCKNLKNIELGNNVSYICGVSGFSGCEKLNSITIPKSLNQIETGTFNDCLDLKDVYYAGSESDWNKIKIGSSNAGLYYATIHYNSGDDSTGTEPTPTPGGGSSGGSTGGGSIGGGGGGAPAPEAPAETPATPETPDTTPAPTSTKPATVKATGTKAKSKALAVYWNKLTGVDGYQIQVATDKNFKKNKKTVTVAKQNASKKTVKNLKKNKKYYVRVRSYKIVNGKKVYGSWSKAKSVKTK